MNVELQPKQLKMIKFFSAIFASSVDSVFPSAFNCTYYFVRKYVTFILLAPHICIDTGEVPVSIIIFHSRSAFCLQIFRSEHQLHSVSVIKKS